MFNLDYSQKFYYVYQKKAQLCDCIDATDNVLNFCEGQNPLANGTVRLGRELYACLRYDKCRIITLISDGQNSETIVLVFRDTDDYMETLMKLSCLPDVEISIQDSKIISYARSISDKLRIGTKVRIVDAQDDDDFIICPVCGVKNDRDSGFPFCLECGEPF